MQTDKSRSVFRGLRRCCERYIGPNDPPKAVLDLMELALENRFHRGATEADAALQAAQELVPGRLREPWEDALYL